MSFKKLKERWQALDAELELDPQSTDVVANCRTRLRQFKTALLLSDILEIGSGLSMAFVWGFLFPILFPDYRLLMYLGVAAILVGCAFLGGARVLRHRHAKPAFGSVSDELQRQRYAINQRIWLLRNIVWWELIPSAFAILTVLIAARGQAKGAGLERVMFIEGPYVVLCIVLFIGVYYLNQRAIRKTLLPLKNDLEKVLQDLN